jgi:cell division ATPase FtsA
VAEATGVSLEKVREIKEGGMDLRKPNGRMEGAIAIYYRHLLAYTVETMRQKMSDAQNMPTFAKPVPVVCAGGGAQIPGFLEMFKDELEKSRGFPVKIDFLRMAREPMHAVAAGCLQAALEETAAQEEPATQAAPAVLERAAVSSAKRGLPSLVRYKTPFAA